MSEVPDPVRVDVLSADPILEHGVRNLLCVQPDILIDDTPDPWVTVVIVIADVLDDQTIRLVRSVPPDRIAWRVLLVVGSASPERAAQATRAGACGLLWRQEVSEDRLLAAVHAAARGEGTLPPDLLGPVLDHVVRSYAEPLIASRQPKLNGRERTVLRLLAEGNSTAEIARALAYSERTVTGIVHTITRRLCVRNRAQAVAHAIKTQLI